MSVWAYGFLVVAAAYFLEDLWRLRRVRTIDRTGSDVHDSASPDSIHERR